ncbi:DNA-directed RNA polymerase subunit omega [Natranaerovirga pectinivora]|uniref:DNA-directed RNA polymerase subunit omega n=1 Tax=Natranaerovirga pectinivora TaxID=682400 RepID=A0A4R3MT97_9FIRM|nr:DNA-directed RNA polymerase subunit omega [Natranaerovirga pectinivora]TCT16940.1 DNA-directed RNA polymerase subunit omega [Natranaerovirga pectinivora]
MLHPSYSDLMNILNENVEIGDEPVVKSRYSIVIATSKRARQLIDGDKPLAYSKSNKPLSIAVEEMNTGNLYIKGSDE